MKDILSKLGDDMIEQGDKWELVDESYQTADTPKIVSVTEKMEVKGGNLFRSRTFLFGNENEFAVSEDLQFVPSFEVPEEIKDLFSGGAKGLFDL